MFRLVCHYYQARGMAIAKVFFKPLARILPQGWRFLKKRSLTLRAIMRHNFVAYKAKHTVPNMGKEKKGVTGNGGHCKWYTYRSARSRYSEDGATSHWQLMRLRMGCPCTGAKTIDRQATPSYRFTRKIRQERWSAPCLFHWIYQTTFLADFSRRSSSLRLLSCPNRLIMLHFFVLHIDKVLMQKY